MNGDITGKCDMRSLSKKYSRAFTLYELIISIVLFALAASLVITFITYMSAFSEKNSASTQRVREQLALRGLGSQALRFARQERPNAGSSVCFNGREQAAARVGS